MVRLTTWSTKWKVDWKIDGFRGLSTGYEEMRVVLANLDSNVVDNVEEFMKRWSAFRPAEKWDRFERTIFKIEKYFD